MSSNFNTKFDNFTENYRSYLNIAPEGTASIFTHKLDLLELHIFIYNIEITADEIGDILNINIDSSQYNSEDISIERDTDETDLEYIIMLLKYRSTLFDGSYPFIISDANTIKLKSNLSNIQKSYLVLLCSSNLNRFKEFMKLLTDDFEDISYCSLKKLFGINVEIRSFGNKTSYVGLNTREKLIALAEEMNIPTKIPKIDKIPLQANKDKGVDIVAWIPFKDKNPNMFMLFTQCASGHNWKNKLSENRQIVSYYNLQEMIVNYGFSVPFEFSTIDNEFEYFENIESGNNILFDRSRLLENMNNTDSFESFMLIDKILSSAFSYE